MRQKRAILAVTLVILMLIMTGCAKKEPITADTFKEICKSHSLSVKDNSKDFSDDEATKKAFIAKSQDGWQIEFYVLEDEHGAIGMFNTAKAKIENFKGSAYSQSSSTLPNSAKYTLISGGHYMHVCRIDNTLVYVDAPKEHSDDVKAVLKELGY